MNKKRLIQIFKQLLIVMIVFSLVFPVNLSAKRKRGAKLSVTMLTGETIRGELLRVNINERTLLLMRFASRTGTNININNVYKIRIRKRSKWLAGPLVAVSIGLAGGIAAEDTDGFTFGAMAFGVNIGIPIGTLVLISGALAGIDEKYRVKGKSESKIKRILWKLESKARYKN